VLGQLRFAVLSDKARHFGLLKVLADTEATGDADDVYNENYDDAIIVVDERRQQACCIAAVTVLLT
jgi:hypothetical protein